jgi:hypothetical protein
VFLKTAVKTPGFKLGQNQRNQQLQKGSMTLSGAGLDFKWDSHSELVEDLADFHKTILLMFHKSTK